MTAAVDWPQYFRQMLNLRILLQNPDVCWNLQQKTAVSGKGEDKLKYLSEVHGQKSKISVKAVLINNLLYRSLKVFLEVVFREML